MPVFLFNARILFVSFTLSLALRLHFSWLSLFFTFYSRLIFHSSVLQIFFSLSIFVSTPFKSFQTLFPIQYFPVTFLVTLSVMNSTWLPCVSDRILFLLNLFTPKPPLLSLFSLQPRKYFKMSYLRCRYYKMQLWWNCCKDTVLFADMCSFLFGLIKMNGINRNKQIKNIYRH